MRNHYSKRTTFLRQDGVTMVELMVALAIGSFLMIGSIQVYNQSRQAYVINDSIARVQETAQFAMDTLEADIRMASNWGQQSRGKAVAGRSTQANANPLGLTTPNTIAGAVSCGADWAFDLSNPIEGSNNTYLLPCAANGGAQPQSDVITTRRATVAVTPLDPGRLQVQTTRIQGALFEDGVLPAGFTLADSETHDLLINSYYVSADSALIPGVPTLRRKMLTVNGGVAAISDQEVAPGVENLQMQFGVDVDNDNAVDRYVNPGDPIFDSTNVAFIPGARVITARIWMVIRSITPETGLKDLRNYSPGDVVLGVPTDEFRRLQVSKTILLRNARS